MLGSLLKYDFRALNKTMIPLQLGVFLAAILGTVCANISFRSIDAMYSGGYYSSSAAATQTVMMSLLQSFTFLAALLLFSTVFVSGFVTLILIARNVYKNFYSSEGYLTFTLPVTVDSHLLSKTISGTVWMMVNVLLMAAAIFMLMVFGLADDGFVNVYAFESFAEFFTPLGFLFFLELLVVGTASIVMSVLQVIFSIVIGGAVARTHKVLAGIGIYVAAATVVNVFSAIVNLFVSFGIYLVAGPSTSAAYSSYSSTWFTEAQPAVLSMGIVSIVALVVFYAFSRVSLKNSLNLD